MFRPSCRSQFSLTDLDMWDTKSRFTSQTSAWCGMAAVSGTGFLSKVSTSTPGSTGGFRQNDPGLRKWQSSSHLAPEGPTLPFPPSPGAELRAARGASSFRQAEMGQWLQDAHERLDAQLDRLTTRNSQLSYNITTAQLFDMKHKQLSEAMSALEQEKEAAELSQFEKSRQRGELHEKVLQLEKDLMQMRSALDRGSNDEPAKATPGSLAKTLPKSQEDFNRQERQRVDTELRKLREALRDAESRAKTQEEERNQALKKLQTSTETQRALLNQIEEMNQRLSHTRENHSEVQEQLSEANNKISQACLEKAILSTQVLKLEDNIKELQAKMTGSDKDHLIKEKADLQKRAQVLELQLKRDQQGSEGPEIPVIQTDTGSHSNKQDQETVLMKEQSKALREANEKLTRELEMIKQKLNTSQSQLQETTAEGVINSKQITHLEGECSRLIRENEELSKMNEGQHEELTEMKEKCCQLRESVEVLELEIAKLQDRCMCLEAEVFEKEEKLHLQEEEHQKQDAARVQTTEELKAVVRHWTEKWQNVALTLQSTQEELEELRKNSRNELQAEAVHVTSKTETLKKEGKKDKEEIENLLQHKTNKEAVLTRAKKESDSLLKVELDACKQELELERSRSQALLHRYKDKGGDTSVQTEDKETLTDLSQSSLLWEPPSDSHSSQNKPPQVCMQSSEVHKLKQKLAEKEKELREKGEALKSLKRLREMEINEAQLKMSALELKLKKKASEDGRDDGGRANVSTTDSPRAQLEESQRRMNQLQQEKTLVVEKLQTLRQLYPVKDEKPSVEGDKDETVCPFNLETEQQRRMVTEQLKSLFKEGQGKEVEKVDNRSAAQTGGSSLQDWTPASKILRSAVDRRSWQQGSGLMPVFEEDEETSDCPGGEEGQTGEEAHAEENVDNQNQQMSTMSAGISHLKAKNVNLLPATLRCKHPVQDCPPAAKKLSDESSSIEVANPSHCSDEIDLQQKRVLSLYPDGTFLAELVDICSPGEDEEEGEDK